MKPSSNIHNNIHTNPNISTLKISVVIPVYNSEKIVGETIDRTVEELESQNWDYEIILVNDNSPDKSWQVLEEKANQNPKLIAINLLKNYGQHMAIYCGFNYASGHYIVTMDDDLQNPPEEIVKLVEKALEGYDVVYGKFQQKAHSTYRRYGSRIIEQMNRRIFHQPPGLTVTNFRLIHQDVIQRIRNYHTNYPYITGLSLMFSSHRANVIVEHHPRKVGKSNYNLIRIARLVSQILFNYSSWPLRMVSTFGFIIALGAFLLGGYFMVRGLLGNTQVSGWATIVVLISFFGGVNIVIVSMLGEYLVRLLRQVSEPNLYYIKGIINHE